MRTKALFIIMSVGFMLSCKPKQEPQMENKPVTENNVTETPVVKKNAIDATKDVEYLVDTYINGLYAIQAAEIVKQKARTEEVKAIAEKVAGTNQKVLENLDRLATAKKISLPSGLNLQQRNELTKLNDKDAQTLEKLFIEQMENEHREDIELLEKVSRESEDNEISTVAISCLATLKTQYDEVVAARERFEL